MASVNELKGTVWKVDNHLSPLTINGRRLDEGDLANPASYLVREKVKALYEKVLQYCEKNKLFEGLGDDLSFELEVSEDKGVNLIRKGFFGSGEKINVLNGTGLKAETGLGSEIRELLAQIAKEPAMDNLGEKVKPLTGLWKIICGAVGLADTGTNITGQVLDITSLIRNSVNATNPDVAPRFGHVAMIPTLFFIGGVTGIIVGGWLGLKSIVEIFQKALEGDREGAIKSFAMLFVYFGFMLVSLTMLVALEAIEVPVGAIFYGVFGLVSAYDLVLDIKFRNELNGTMKNIEKPADLVTTLELLQTKAKAKPRFVRQTTPELHRRVQNEITDDMIKRVKDGDHNAIAQAFYLIEAVSKENYSKIFVGSCAIMISILGLLAVFIKPVKIASALFAVGTAFWLISLDWTLPKSTNIKEGIINKLWNRTSLGTGNHHRFAEMNKAVQMSLWRRNNPDSQEIPAILADEPPARIIDDLYRMTP